MIWRRGDPDVHLFYKMNLKKKAATKARKQKKRIVTN